MSFRPGALAALLSLPFLLAAGGADAGVGFQHLMIPDGDGPPTEVGVWYPTGAAGGPNRVDPSHPLAMDAAVEGRDLPLVVMSHGKGGAFASHVDTAEALATAGFVVAALTHPGDNWRDDSHTVQVWERPAQLKHLTDYMLSAWPAHDRIDPARVGAFGFSSGGFTVLVAAGGEPDLAATTSHCKAHPDGFECKLLATHPVTLPADLAWPHDARIKAIVVAAPALGYTFGPAGLAKVRLPVQLWRPADDQLLPHPFYAEAVRRDLPTPPEMHVVDGAGHFDFLAPCSRDLAQRAPAVCTSEPGFDRVAFHAAFDKAVVAFFQRTLAAQP